MKLPSNKGVVLVAIACVSVLCYFLLPSDAPQQLEDGVMHAAAEPAETPQEDALDTGTTIVVPKAVKIAGPKTTATRKVVPESTQSTIESCSIRGSVLDDIGNPIAAFTLQGEQRAQKFGSKWTEHSLGTFANGSFRLNDLEPGYWRIQAHSDGHKNSTNESFLLPRDGRKLELRLQRLTYIRGTILNPNGTPAGGAKVIAIFQGSKQNKDADDNGQFLIKVKPGPFSCIGVSTEFAKSSPVEGMVALSETADVVLQLKLGAHLVGKVLNEDGEPRADWWIDLQKVDGTYEERQRQADDQGEFAIRNLSPGTYRVGAHPEKDGSARRFHVRGAAELVEGETTELILGGKSENTILVHGTLYIDGQPTAGKTIWAGTDNATVFAKSKTVVTDEEGHYEVEFAAPGPGHLLVVMGKQYFPAIAIQVADVKKQKFDIHTPTGQLGGEVHSLDPKRKKPWSVRCAPNGFNPAMTHSLTRTLECDEQGKFCVRLPHGRKLPG